MRILLVPPLGVKSGINDEDRIVRVLNVWEFKARWSPSVTSLCGVVN